MSNLIKESFLKLTIRFSAGFLVFFSIFKMVLKIFKTGSFNQMVADYFGSGNWHFFVAQILIGSLMYGLFMAGYYKFIKK